MNADYNCDNLTRPYPKLLQFLKMAFEDFTKLAFESILVFLLIQKLLNFLFSVKRTFTQLNKKFTLVVCLCGRWLEN